MSRERAQSQLGEELTDDQFIAFGAALAELTSMDAWGNFEQVVNAYLTAIAVQGLDSDLPKAILRAQRDAVKAVFGNVRQLILRAQSLQAEREVPGEGRVLSFHDDGGSLAGDE